ncbi:putative reverse transcriptase domain-containing protein [Tanacetum coccineum]
MTPRITVQAMIDQALQRNSTNGDTSHSSHGDDRRNVQTAHPCFYADFMNCQPLNFKGTEGVKLAPTEERSLTTKGRPDYSSRTTWSPTKTLKGRNVARSTIWVGEKKAVCGKFDKCTKSSGNTNVANTQKGNGANPKGNGCFECEALGNFKRDCPKLKNKDGEPVEVMDREVKQLRRSRVPIVKVRWNSRRGPEFTWERKDQFRKKYPHLFTKTAPSSSAV